MKKFLFASVATLALVGYVTADEFTASIMKVDGNTVTFVKKAAFGAGGGAGKKGGKVDPADPATQPKEEKADMASDCKVLKGEAVFTPADPPADKKGDPAAKKGGAAKKGAGGFGGGKLTYKAGDPIEGGVKSETFTKADEKKGVSVHITTNADNKITQILVLTPKGKKGGIDE
jgi:hypothetical protein